MGGDAPQEVPRLLLETGYWCIRQGMIPEARSLLKGAQVLAPGSPAPSMFLGMAHFAAGEYVEAERTYREVLGRHEDDDLTRAFLGESLIAQRRWGEAQRVLKEVVERNRHPAAITFATELLTQLQRGLLQGAE